MGVSNVRLHDWSLLNVTFFVLGEGSCHLSLWSYWKAVFMNIHDNLMNVDVSFRTSFITYLPQFQILKVKVTEYKQQNASKRGSKMIG